MCSWLCIMKMLPYGLPPFTDDMMTLQKQPIETARCGRALSYMAYFTYLCLCLGSMRANDGHVNIAQRRIAPMQWPSFNHAAILHEQLIEAHVEGAAIHIARPVIQSMLSARAASDVSGPIRVQVILVRAGDCVHLCLVNLMSQFCTCQLDVSSLDDHAASVEMTKRSMLHTGDRGSSRSAQPSQEDV